MTALAFLVVLPAGAMGADRVAEFLTVPIDAGSAAAGGADVARPATQLSLFANPAAAAVPRVSTSIAHASWIAQQNLSAAQLSVPLPGRAGGVSFYGMWMDHGDVPRVDMSGSSVSGLRPRDIAAGVAYGVRFGRATFGVGARYLEEDLAVARGNGIAYDLGLLVEMGQWRLGASALGLGGKLTYEDQTSYDTPRRLAVGLSYRPWRESLEADFQFANLSDVEGTLGSMGLHWHAVPGTLVLRGGADVSSESRDDEFAGYRLGFGISHGAITIDYAFIPHRELGQAHLVGIRFGAR